MDFSKNEILDLLARDGGHIVRESAGQRFARDTLVVKTDAGRDLEVELGGFAYHPVEVGAAVFADLQRAQFIYEDGRDSDGNAVWRIAKDGTARIAA